MRMWSPQQCETGMVCRTEKQYPVRKKTNMSKSQALSVTKSERLRIGLERLPKQTVLKHSM